MGMINTRRGQICTLIWLIKDSHLIKSYRVLVILDGYDGCIPGETKTLLDFSRYSVLLTKYSELINSYRNSVLFTEENEVLDLYIIDQRRCISLEIFPDQRIFQK